MQEQEKAHAASGIEVSLPEGLYAEVTGENMKVYDAQDKLWVTCHNKANGDPDEWQAEIRRRVLTALDLPYSADMSESLSEPETLCVVVAGNPFDGMKIHGPFTDFEGANLWAERNVTDDWWSMKVETVLYTFVVHSNVGERTWQAEDEQHAREQHLDAFADEQIISVRKLIR